MHLRLGLPLALCAAAAGCVVGVPPAPIAPSTRGAAGSEVASKGPAGAPPAPRAPPGAPAPAPVAPPYAPSQATADALSGPLEIVGVGAWPGLFRRLSCVYRNLRVFVVDERCSDPREPSSLVVHVLSPTRGRATIFADAGAPIGRARRPDYRSFGAASTAPRPPPAALDVAMDYERVVAAETDAPGTVRATCSAGTQRPQGSCSKGAPVSAAEYAASVEPFLREPPAGWYELVHELVRLRVQAHAGIRPAALPLPRLVAWGASWARDLDVTVDEENLKRVGNRYGRTAAIALTADGGALIAGTTQHGGVTVPAVVRADASGSKRWLKALPERGFVTHEIASVAVVPGGAIVLSPGYPDPGWKPTARVIRLDEAGNVRWQWLGRGKDRHRIPQVVTAQPTAQGTVLLRGYVQLIADGDVHAWNAELDGRGKAIREEVGPVLPDHAASFE
jgi:hypothetical protein